MLNKCSEVIKQNAALLRAVFCTLVLVLLGSGSLMATDPTITDVGNASGYITAAITALGTLAGLVMGGFFGFWLVKKTMRWAGKIG